MKIYDRTNLSNAKLIEDVKNEFIKQFDEVKYKKIKKVNMICTFDGNQYFFSFYSPKNLIHLYKTTRNIK